MEEVTSKWWKKSGVVFYEKVILPANEGLARILTEGRPARELSQCCSSKWGAADKPQLGWWQALQVVASLRVKIQTHLRNIAEAEGTGRKGGAVGEGRPA